MELPFTSFQLKSALEVGLQLIHPDFCKWLWHFGKSCGHLAGDELFSGMSDESKGCGIRRMSMSDLGIRVYM